MEKIEYLPLGSIVIMRGGVKKIMITGRGLATKLGEGVCYFDYAGCLYPEGIMDDSMVYFNHENIFKVVFNGYSDTDNNLMVTNIQAWVENCGYKKGEPQKESTQL